MRNIGIGHRTGFVPGAALLGAAVGAAAALLMAPSTGERTRKTIARKGGDVAKRAIDEIRLAVDKCEGFLQTQRGPGDVAELRSGLH